MIDFNKEFESGNLFLRPSIIEDAEEMFSITQDLEMWKYFTANLSIKDELIKWLKGGIEDKGRLAFTVIDQNSNCIVGATSIGNISSRDKRAEIGWTWLGRKAQGTGINGRVKMLLTDYLFEECGIERVELKTDVLNLAARKALEKIGFQEEGVLRSHTQMIHDRRRDTIFYSMLREEWLEIKGK